MYTIEELNLHSVEQLQDIATQLGIKKNKNLGKEELVYGILDEQALASREELSELQEEKAKKIPQPKNGSLKGSSFPSTPHKTTSQPVEAQKTTPPRSTPTRQERGKAPTHASQAHTSRRTKPSIGLRSSAVTEAEAIQQNAAKAKNRAPERHDENQQTGTNEESEKPNYPLQPFQCTISGEGVLELMPDGYGFLRSASYNYIASPDDTYVSAAQVKSARIKTGDTIRGQLRPPREDERYYALVSIDEVNGKLADELRNRSGFEFLTPLFSQ